MLETGELLAHEVSETDPDQQRQERLFRVSPEDGYVVADGQLVSAARQAHVAVHHGDLVARHAFLLVVENGYTKRLYLVVSVRNKNYQITGWVMGGIGGHRLWMRQ